MNKFVVLGLVMLVAFVVLAGFFYKAPPAQEEPVACTQDAKLCPDGTYVGRLAPSCEFPKCSGDVTSTSSVPVKPVASTSPVRLPSTTKPAEPIACPAIAKACQDGTYVGMTAVNGKCEFSKCPGEK